MIELTSNTLTVGSFMLEHFSGLGWPQDELGRMYREHVTDKVENQQACGCSAKLCHGGDRGICGIRGCCGHNVNHRVRGKEKCLTCTNPCGVVGALMEVL